MTKFHQAGFLAQGEYLDEEMFERRKVEFSKITDRAVVGLVIGRQNPEGTNFPVAATA